MGDFGSWKAPGEQHRNLIGSRKCDVVRADLFRHFGVNAFIFPKSTNVCMKEQVIKTFTQTRNPNWSFLNHIIVFICPILFYNCLLLIVVNQQQ